MINFATFLLESRLDFLKQQHQHLDSSHDSLAVHRSAPDIIDHFATHADPSKNKANTQWIINRYKDRDFRQEDHGRIRSALENFQKHKSKLAQKDINKYKSLSDLEDAVEPHIGTVSRKQEKSQIKHEGADLIHDGPQFMVHRLKTKEAACHYGKGTKWCTAADHNNAFDHYNSEGPLYVITHKPTQEKHQFHFESDQFMDAKDRDIDLPKFVSKNPELKEVKEFRDKSPYFGRNEKEIHEIIGKALVDKHWRIRKGAIKHPMATSDHVDIALNDEHFDVKEAALVNPNATAEQIEKNFAENNHWFLRKLAIQHPNATKELLDKALTDSDSSIKIRALRNPNLTREHIDKALTDPNLDIRAAAIENRNATEKHIDKALADPSEYVRAAAIRHRNATEKHIDKALADPDEYVRTAALHHPKLTPQHLTIALRDPSSKIRYAAISHPKATEAHISKALEDTNWGVRRGAINNPKATAEHISKALNDKEVDVRYAAIKHSKATAEHINKALSDPNHFVRIAATDVQRERGETK